MWLDRGSLVRYAAGVLSAIHGSESRSLETEKRYDMVIDKLSSEQA